MAQLWQVPVFLASLPAFAGALYLLTRHHALVDVVEIRIATARQVMDERRPAGALPILNGVLSAEHPTRGQEARVRLMLAEAVEAAQGKDRIRANDATIVQQMRYATMAGAHLGAKEEVRLGAALESLGRQREAAEAYARALTLDPTLGPVILRRTAELQLAQGMYPEATGSLERYLTLPGLSDADRAWAGLALTDLRLRSGQQEGASELLAASRQLKVDNATLGRIACKEGEIAVAAGDDAAAERQFRLARNLLTVSQDLDARAAYELGRLLLKRGKPAEALSFFADVLTSHPGSEPYVLSRLGRGWARVAEGDDDAGLEDLAWVSGQMERPEVRGRDAAEALRGFEDVEKLLTAKGDLRGTLEVLGDEKALMEGASPAFLARLAGAYAARGDQLAESSPAEAAKCRVHAAEASLAEAKALTVVDNEGYGAALWRAVELYDKAGAGPEALATMELFARERPGDPLAPQALLRAGKAYAGLGEMDRAVDAFERCRARYGRTLSATQAAIPLSQALIAQGPRGYPLAERVLVDLLESNPAVTPEADEFKNGLFELAQLYYRENRCEDSIARLDEILKRYPTDERAGLALFMMADAYRRSAELLRRPGEDVAAPAAAEAENARRERLGRARGLFDKTIAHYREHVPTTDAERNGLRMSYFDRADCAFDLGQYEESIKLYDAAAFRYQDDASALAAHVQIVNANVALGRLPEARAANERAKWLLRRLPAAAFASAGSGGGGPAGMSRAYWEQWLAWSAEAPMKAGVGGGRGWGQGGRVGRGFAISQALGGGVVRGHGLEARATDEGGCPGGHGGLIAQELQVGGRACR